MSKAFLTEDTPSLFENVCQVSKTAKTDKRPSKSDYLSLRKSLKEFRSFNYHLDVYHCEKKEDYDEQAKAELNQIYIFLKKHFKNFKVIYENMKSDGIAREGVFYPSKGAKIANFIQYIYNFYFHKFYSLESKMDIEKLDDFHKKQKQELFDKLYEKFNNYNQAMRRLRSKYLEAFSHKVLYHLYGFNYTDNILRFYKNNRIEIDNFFKSKFQRYEKKYDLKYNYGYRIDEFLIDSFKDFIRFLNEDRYKMREFLELLRALKEKTFFINLIHRNEVMARRNKDYFEKNTRLITEKREFFKSLKKNSKAIRDFLKSQKNTNKEEK